MKENKVISKKNRMDEEEGVEAYLELLKETERLLSMGEELLENEEWFRLWKNLDQLILYPVFTEKGEHMICTHDNGMKYANLFTRPAYDDPKDEDYEYGGTFRNFLNEAYQEGFSLLIHPTIIEYRKTNNAVLINPKAKTLTPVWAAYNHEQKIYIIY